MNPPEPYRVIFPHPAPLYQMHLPPFAASHNPSNPTQNQLEPVDLSVSKRSSSPPHSSSSSSVASSPSSPPSPYSRASPRSPLSQLRCSPSHALPPAAPSVPYHSMVTPVISSSPGVMVSPVMVPILYSPHLHLQPQIIMSPSAVNDEERRQSREHASGETSFFLVLQSTFVQVSITFCSFRKSSSIPGRDSSSLLKDFFVNEKVIKSPAEGVVLLYMSLNMSHLKDFLFFFIYIAMKIICLMFSLLFECSPQEIKSRF